MGINNPSGDWEPQSWLKKVILAWALASQLVQAEANEDLASALKDQKIELSKDTTKSVEWVKKEVNDAIWDRYLNHLKVYWVWEKSNDQSFNGVWMEIYTDNLKWVVEKWQDFTKVWWVWRYDLSKWAYIKWGVSYLWKKLDVDWNKYDVSQLSTWVWAWVWNEKFNIEAGHIVSKIDVSGIDWADTTAQTTYVEGITRMKWQAGQLDLTWEAMRKSIYGETNWVYSAKAEYYPTNDVQVWLKQTSESIHSGDFKIMWWMKYTFSKWKWSPYLEANKNIWEHSQAKFVYEDNIAKKPLSNKDTFENTTLTSNLVDEWKIVSKIQEKKASESSHTPEVVNNAPTASDFTINGGWRWHPSVTFDISSHISDDKTPVVNLVFEAVAIQNNGTPGDMITINTSAWPNITVNATSWWWWNAYIDYRIKDANWAYSPTKRITLNGLDNL